MSYDNDRRIGPLGIVIIAVVAIIIALAVFYWCYRTVGTGEVGIVTVWGSATKQVGEGLTTVNPLWEDLVKIDVKTQRIDQTATAATKDIQNVKANVAVIYHLDTSKTLDLYKEIGLGYKDRVIVPAVQEIVKQVTAKYTASQIVTQREQLKNEIQTLLEQRLGPLGIVIESVNILNIDFSDSFNAAIEETTTRKQKELVEQNQLNIVRIQSQQKVVQAQANYNATITNAQAEADKLKIEAQGTENAIKTISTALKDNPNYLSYYGIQKWNGVLPLFGTGSEGSGLILNSDIINKAMGNQTK